MSESTVPHSHYVAVAEELERKSEALDRYREQDREIRALLKSVGLASIVQEGCVKYPLIDHIRQMVEWQKRIEQVRNALVKELKRRGIPEGEMRALIAQEPESINVPAEAWHSLVSALIDVYRQRGEMFFDGDTPALHHAILGMRRRLDAIVPPETWGEFIGAQTPCACKSWPSFDSPVDGVTFHHSMCDGAGERASKNNHIDLRCPHCSRVYTARIGNNPLVKDGLTITPVPLPADVEIQGEQ